MKKDAVVGEAEAKRDSTIAEAKANEQKMQATDLQIWYEQKMQEKRSNLTSIQAKLSNDTEIARAKRDFELKKATYDIEVRLWKRRGYGSSVNIEREDGVAISAYWKRIQLVPSENILLAGEHGEGWGRDGIWTPGKQGAGQDQRGGDAGDFSEIR